MAHFAELDADGVVLRVDVVNNDVMQNLPFPDSEQPGVKFLTTLYKGGVWKQTSYTGSFRKNYAGAGYIYDAQRDAFIPPKPYPSWVLNEKTCRWEAPLPYPNDGKVRVWDEGTISWVEVNRDS